jgi:hypothetical protein
MLFRLLASFVAIGAFFAGSAGCGKTVYQSHEGHYCSIDDNEDPNYQCSRTRDLVCITTYAETIKAPDGGVQRTVPIYLCRQPCEPGNRCPMADDVCCPGMIVGRDYGATHGCVPLRFCEMPPPTPDAGPRDTALRDTAAPDTVADGPSGDAPDGADAADAPAVDVAAVDAGVDAATD